MIDGDIQITNIGSSELTHLGALSSVEVGADPIEFHEVPPTAFASGATLTPNGAPLVCCKINMGNGFGTEIQKGTMFFGIHVAVSYEDIFGNLGVKCECFMYEPKRNKFVGCPVPSKTGGHIYLP